MVNRTSTEVPTTEGRRRKTASLLATFFPKLFLPAAWEGVKCEKGLISTDDISQEGERMNILVLFGNK
jgi:hypothetical protein